jgi:hypothetical protein
MNSKRRLAIVCAALLISAVGCDAKLEEMHESDAELSCREEGYDIESDAYNDCVEEKSKSN